MADAAKQVCNSNRREHRDMGLKFGDRTPASTVSGKGNKMMVAKIMFHAPFPLLYLAYTIVDLLSERTIEQVNQVHKANHKGNRHIIKSETQELEDRRYVMRMSLNSDWVSDIRNPDKRTVPQSEIQ